MVETDQSSTDSGKELSALLSEARLRERAARKSAVVYTLVPVIIGVAFLAVSLLKVSRLQQTATNLKNQIESKTDELKRKKSDLDALEKKTKEVEDNLKVTTATLDDINKNPKNAQQKARQALLAISRDSKTTAKKPTPEDSKPDTSDVETVVVPNLVGKSYVEARQSLDAVGLSYEGLSQAKINVVIKQNPVPGTKIAKGSKIRLWFSSHSNP
jgi:hypothetical protein